MNRIPVTIYTDGSCIGNPGPGGWAAILTYGMNEKMICGGCPKTTNNCMELTAVCEAVLACKKPCDITLVSDSTYVIMTGDKWTKWMKKHDFPNREVWMKFFAALKNGNHKIRYTHVYGHSGHEYNERCDLAAKEQAKKFAA